MWVIYSLRLLPQLIFAPIKCHFITPQLEKHATESYLIADSRSLILERAFVCLESFMLHSQDPPLGRENFSHQDIVNFMVSLRVFSVHKQS
jgi:hypothetical protein